MRLIFSTAKTLAATLIVSASVSAHSEILYTTGFDGVDDSQPANWTVTNTAIKIVGNEYRHQGGTERGLSYYSGTLTDSSSASSLTDYTVSADFRHTGNAYSGLIARYTSDSQFYHLRVRRTEGVSDGTVFELFRIGSQAGASGTVLLASASDFEYPSAKSWRIQMTVQGSSITGEVFNDTGALVSTISATDTSFTSGTAGVRSEVFGNVDVYETFTISEVPEPAGAFTLITLGSCAVLGRRR